MRLAPIQERTPDRIANPLRSRLAGTCRSTLARRATGGNRSMAGRGKWRRKGCEGVSGQEVAMGGSRRGEAGRVRRPGLNELQTKRVVIGHCRTSAAICWRDEWLGAPPSKGEGRRRRVDRRSLASGAANRRKSVGSATNKPKQKDLVHTRGAHAKRLRKSMTERRIF